MDTTGSKLSKLVQVVSRNQVIRVRKTVLIVDDVSFNRKLIANHLVSQGFDCVEADSGETAIQTSNAKEFDIILMDVNLPGIDGVEATQKIRSNAESSSQNARIIGISAHASAKDRQSFLDAGMNDCLPKPIDLSSLVVVITNHSQLNPNRQVAPTTENDNEILDINAALKRIGSNHDLYLRFVALFRKDIRPLVTEGKVAAEAGNLEQLGKLAHRIRGMAANLAATRVSQSAKILEHACESKMHEQAVKNFYNLLQQLELLDNEFVNRNFISD